MDKSAIEEKFVNHKVDELYNTWQECMSLKITFYELEKVDTLEIRELLDVQEYNDSQ